MKWTQNEELRLSEMRRSGMAVRAIAKAMGRSESSVENRLGLLGIVVEPRWTPEEISRVLTGQEIPRSKAARKVMRCRLRKH